MPGAKDWLSVKSLILMDSVRDIRMIFSRKSKRSHRGAENC